MRGRAPLSVFLFAVPLFAASSAFSQTEPARTLYGVIQDQTGLDRFSQANLVREQPAHQRRAGRRLGGVELVRE